MINGCNAARPRLSSRSHTSPARTRTCPTCESTEDPHIHDAHKPNTKQAPARLPSLPSPHPATSLHTNIAQGGPSTSTRTGAGTHTSLRTHTDETYARVNIKPHAGAHSPTCRRAQLYERPEHQGHRQAHTPHMQAAADNPTCRRTHSATGGPDRALVRAVLLVHTRAVVVWEGCVHARSIW